MPERMSLSGPSALMPQLARGPQLATAVMPDNFIIRLSYLSEAKALQAVLPQGLKLNGEPIITFLYRHSENVAWVPGGEINAVGATISVRYKGEQDEATGAYWPFLWEDVAITVILGREVFGVAKLYADISIPLLKDGVWHGVLSERGRSLIELRFWRERQAVGEELESLREQGRQGRVIGWKHIPSCDMKSADLSYPTLYQSPNRILSGAFGRGEVLIPPLDSTTSIWNRHVIEALRSIPLLEPLGAVRINAAVEHHIGSGRRLR